MTEQTALYRHFDRDGRLLYVGISLSAIARLAQHKHGSHWSKDITNVTIEQHPTRKAAVAAEIKAIREEHPMHNIVHARDEKLQLFKLSREFLKEQFSRIARIEHDRRMEEEAARKAEEGEETVYKLLSLADIMKEAEKGEPPYYRTYRTWAKLIAQAIDRDTWNDMLWECADEIEFYGDLIGFFAHLFSGLKLADGEVVWA